MSTFDKSKVYMNILQFANYHFVHNKRILTSFQLQLVHACLIKPSAFPFRLLLHPTGLRLCQLSGIGGGPHLAIGAASWSQK